MITKERLEQLDREALAAEQAYQTALDAEKVPMMSRFQTTPLSQRVLALRDARDTATVRRYDAAMALERASR